MYHPVNLFALGISQEWLTSVLYSILLMAIGTGATIGTVFAGLHKVKQVEYLKFSVSMIVNSYIMSFIVCAKAYFDILTNRPFKWIKTERNGVVSQ